MGCPVLLVIHTDLGNSSRLLLTRLLWECHRGKHPDEAPEESQILILPL